MKKKTRSNLLIALAAALAVTLIAGSGALRRVDKWAQDTLFQRRGVTSPEIVLIGIDEEALAALGPYNTWTREVMASALEALAADPAQLPAVVAIDTLYSGESAPQSDERLVRAVQALPAVVTATAADFGTAYQAVDGGVEVSAFSVLGYETAFEALRAVSTQGHINAMYDGDGIMRHALLYLDVPAADGLPAQRVYSMAYETARLYLASQGRSVPLPETDPRGHFYIPFTGKPGDFYDGYSIAKLIDGTLPPQLFAGKIVLIGPYAVGLQDAYFTPISRDEQMNGVELQANVIQAFLENSFKQEVSDLPQLAALFLAAFGAMWLFLRSKPLRGGLIALLLAAAAPAAAMLLYGAGYVVHPLWIPAAAALLYVAAVARHYTLAALERQRVTRTFERYVAPEIVQEILKEGADGLKLGGSLRNIAVLFVDVRGFTTMSERLQPEQVVFILNRYLAMTSSCVEKNRGTLDKFVGDATMAFWGAPLDMEDPVYWAARTALDIVAGAHQVSEQLKNEIGEELRVGVGVHFGPAVVGNMGSERHMDYTAIGDTVNTAARLEANAPGGTVYISRAVADILGERAKTTSLGGSIRLKGKAEGFEVLTLDELA